MSEPAPVAVVAIVWTYNRFDLAAVCVRAVLDQERPADRVIVVDSASPDGSGERLSAAYPEVEVIELAENDGPGAAIAAAMERVSAEPPDYYWLVEDDSMPSRACLATALEQAANIDKLGILGPVGCVVRWGQWYATPELQPGQQREVDLVVLDGALVAGDAVRKVGLPKTDYFIMMIDVEYPLRIAGAGFRMVQAGLPYEQGRLGAAASDSSWRNYYQTRNHLRMVVDLRSPRLFVGFVIRTAKHFGYAIGHRQWAQLALRLRGLADGVRCRMGRTVEPPKPSGHE